MYFYLYCVLILMEKVTDVSSSYGYDHQVAVRRTSTSVSTVPTCQKQISTVDGAHYQ
jgi:hypothetical protein